MTSVLLSLIYLINFLKEVNIPHSQADMPMDSFRLAGGCEVLGGPTYTQKASSWSEAFVFCLSVV